ncbi:MAG: hypothetical protein ACFFCP_19850 [Promethearchaeota archaeon]
MEMRGLERAAIALSKVCALLLAICLIVSQVIAIPFSLADDDISLEGPNNLWVELYNDTHVDGWVDISRTDSGYLLATTLASADGRIMHIATNGSVLFQTTLGGDNSDEIRSATQCRNGDFVTVGRTRSFGANETSGSSKLWLARIAANGTVIWNKWYPDTVYGQSVAECEDGSFIITAIEPHLLHVSSNGSYIWSKSYGDWDISDGYRVIESDDGGFAFTGAIDTNPSGDIDYKAWLVRTDPEGEMLWNCTYGEAPFNVGRSLIQCSDGGFAIIGESGSDFYFPRSPWLIRTEENGTLLWDNIYSTGYGHGVVQCADGGFGIAGTYAEDGSYSGWNALFIRVDEEGNEQWRSVCAGTMEDRGYSLALTDSGQFVVAGWSHQGSSRVAFLWQLSDDYVTPSLTPTDNSDIFGVIIAGASFTGIFIAVVIILYLRRESPS